MSELVTDNPAIEIAGWCALNFLRGVQVGVNEWEDLREIETIFGKSKGFVYFIGIGGEYITHVKIGFTAKNPYTRLASLQTGCPFKLRMLGFVYGNADRERELHGVLKEYRVEGEWFEYSDYARQIILYELEEDVA